MLKQSSRKQLYLTFVEETQSARCGLERSLNDFDDAEVIVQEQKRFCRVVLASI